MTMSFKRTVLSAAVVAGGIAAAVAPGGEENPAPAGWTISGKVLDAGGRPFAGAEVSARRPDGAIVSRTKTGPDGSYALLRCPAGEEVRLEVDAPGMALEVQRWRLPFLGPGRSAPLALSPIRLQEICSLEVHVLGPGGGPVSGAKITLKPNRIMISIFETRSMPVPVPFLLDEDLRPGSRGAYHKDRLPPGIYELLVDAPGLVVVERQITIPQVGQLDIRLEAGARIAGTVVDGDGRPLAGATVRGGHREVRTDAGGGFRIDGFPPEECAVVAEAEGFGPSAGLTGPGALDLILRLEREVTVRGRALLGPGRPAAGAEVVPFQTWFPLCSIELDFPQARAASDGSFTIRGIPHRCDFRIAIWHPEGRWRSKEKEGMKGFPGQTFDLGEVVLDPGITLILRAVEMMTGKPTAGVPISLHVPFGPEAITDGDGRATFRNVAPGTYRPLSGGYKVLPEEIEVSRSVTVDVLLAPPDPPPVPPPEPPPGPEGSVSGRVLVGGVPEKGIEVGDRTARMWGRCASTGSDGRFVVNALEPGPQRIGAFLPGGRHASVEVTVVAGKVVDAGDFLLEKGEDISGRIIDASGQPVAGAWIRIGPENHEEEWDPRWVEGGSGFDGSFRLSGIRKGKVEVEVRRLGFRFPESTVDVPASAFIVRGEPLWRLRGRVVEADGGAPLPVEVYVYLPPAGLDMNRQIGCNFEEFTSTDEDGRFLLEEIPLGAILIVIRRFDPDRLAVFDGRDFIGKRDVTLQVKEGTRFLARILDGRRRPVRGAKAFAYDFQAGVRGEGTSDGDGFVEISDLREAAHRIFICHPGHGLGDFPVEVKAGSRPADLELCPGAILNVVIRNAAADPLDRVKVEVLDGRGDDLGAVLGHFKAVVEDREKGRFAFKCLPPGRYRVRARRDRAVSEEKEVDVGPKGAEVILTLPEAAER
jgi:protocatechuate 3,4-dioxygenase beta subunit